MTDIEDTLRRIALKSSDRWARFLAAEALAQWRTDHLLAMKQTSENGQEVSMEAVRNVGMAIGTAGDATEHRLAYYLRRGMLAENQHATDDDAQDLLNAAARAAIVAGSEMHPLTLSEIAEQQTEELKKWAFRLGAQSCREMLARFVENSPPTDRKVIAGSMRANWHPGWGDDPGRPSEIARNALGDTDERDAWRDQFAQRAVDHAMQLLSKDGEAA